MYCLLEDLPFCILELNSVSNTRDCPSASCGAPDTQVKKVIRFCSDHERASALAHVELVARLRPRQVIGRARRLVTPAQLARGLHPDPPPAWRPLAAGLFAERAPQSGPQP